MTATTKTVTLTPIEEKLDGELSADIQIDCSFCEKTVRQQSDFRQMAEKLSGDDFYCSFCLRNGLNTKRRNHILIMSFRAIIGYYYYGHYCITLRKISWSEIKAYIEAHTESGLQNPVFSYDPETYLWYIDFSKVGKSTKKISIDDVMKTVSNILASFNLGHHIKNINVNELYAKYDGAIRKYYENRTRPEDKKTLVPTLKGLLGPDLPSDATFEDTRLFQSKDFLLLR